MHETIAWQAFANTGEPILGKSAFREDFAHDRSLIMGSSHVWLWRQVGNEMEILLQRRHKSKKTWPEFYDISAAGHIDAGEAPLVAAVREAREELGVEIDPHKLYFVQTLRTPLDAQEIDYVYLYKIEEPVSFSFDDGEVAEVEWWSLDRLREAVADPDAFRLVPQGDIYFSVLLHTLGSQMNNV